MSVNEEEAATSAPADVILLEGGEKGKDVLLACIVQKVANSEPMLLCNQ